MVHYLICSETDLYRNEVEGGASPKYVRTRFFLSQIMKCMYANPMRGAYIYSKVLSDLRDIVLYFWSYSGIYWVLRRNFGYTIRAIKPRTSHKILFRALASCMLAIRMGMEKILINFLMNNYIIQSLYIRTVYRGNRF